MVAISCRDVLLWSLTPGQSGDAPEGRNLIEAMGSQDATVHLLMDSAYEGDETRAAAWARNFIPVVPAHPQRKQPWLLDKDLYRQRNEVERLFRRIKAYRRVFTRYDKLDMMFAAFVSMALICEHLR
jgi:transposase